MSFPLPALTLRAIKGTPLTWAEMDGNLTTLKDFCNVVGQLFNSDGSVDPTLLKSVLLNYIATSFIGSTASFLSPIGAEIQVLKTLDPSTALPDSGAAWLLEDGAVYLQTDYPKLFAYLGHDYDGDSKVQGVTIAGGGTGYQVGDVLTIQGGIGAAALLTVNTVAGGVITAVTLSARGNYTTAPASPAGVRGGHGNDNATFNLTFPPPVNGATQFRVPNEAGTFFLMADDQIAAGAAGGEKTHQLSVAELAAHRHFLANTDTTWNQALTAANFLVFQTGSGSSDSAEYKLNGSATGPSIGLTGSQGSNTPHNNMPPYRAGYKYILAGYRVNAQWI